MEKRILTIGLVFLFVFSLVFPIILGSYEKKSDLIMQSYNLGNTFYVGGTGPNNYTKIQDAIDNASDGYTVFVYTGKYLGHIFLNKSINLIGENKNTTFIIGFFAYTISIVTDWVNMSGFTIKYNEGRLGEGFRIDSSNNNINNNIIDIPNDRIRINGNNNIFMDNLVKNCYIYLSGYKNTISYNIIINENYGLFLTKSSDNIISNNSFFNSGLFISEDNVWNNNVIDNKVNGKQLIQLENKTGLVINNDSGQIILINCTDINVQNQKIINTTVGIQIWRSNNCILSDNLITGNYYGIYNHGFNNTIKNCSIIKNNYGLFLSDDNNSISSNNISKNKFSIYIDYSTNYNNITSNTINSNYNCIQMDYGSNYNNILNNNITNNYNEIRISSDNNIISYNNIINNNGDGIHLSNSNNNYIINNNISNNNQSGIYLSGNNNTISINTITKNNDGLYLYEAINNEILNNKISNNNQGIQILNSNNNNITINNISENTKGIVIFSSTNNIILKNNFLDNQQDAFFNKSMKNIWDYNYWNRPKIFPKIIFGTIELNYREILWLNIDWHPAKELYNI